MLGSKPTQPRKLWHPWDLSDDESDEEEKKIQESQTRPEVPKNNNNDSKNGRTPDLNRRVETSNPRVPFYPNMDAQSFLNSAAARFMGLSQQQSLLPRSVPFPMGQPRGAGIMIRNPIVAAVLGDPQQADPLQVLQQNRCAHCGMMFRMTSDLVQHMRMHHQRRPTVPARREDLGKRKGKGDETSADTGKKPRSSNE